MAEGAALGLAGGQIGSSIVGGLLSASGSKKAQKRNIRWQREQLQNAIQYRVADAKKAGIHPLYAMGANIQSPSPVEGDGGELGRAVSDMGQGIGQLSARYLTAPEKQMQQATLQNMRASGEKDMAMAQFYRSQAVNAQTGAGPAAQFNTDPQGNIIAPGTPAVEGQITVQPAQVISQNPSDQSVTAGRNPAQMKVDLHPKLPFWIPYTQEGYAEALENVGMIKEPGTVMQSAKRFGESQWEYIRDWYDWTYLGRPPSRDWNREPQPGGQMYGPSPASMTWQSIMREVEKYKNEAKRYYKRWNAPKQKGR